MQFYSCTLDKDQRVFLIDTPGFNDTVKSDTEVLREIAAILAQLYSRSVHLTGIVYLHRITDNRMGGASLRNLKIFQKLCGQAAYRNVVLTTTMWDTLQSSGDMLREGESNERQLLSDEEWWGAMTRHGCRVAKHAGQVASARKIIGQFISNRNPRLILAIQEEMVDRRLALEDTAAGLEAGVRIRATEKKKQSELNAVQEDMQEALRSDDKSAVATLQSQKLKLQNELEAARQAQQVLKVDFDHLRKEKEEKYQKLFNQAAREREANEKAIRRYEEELQQLKASQQAASEEIMAYQERLEKTENEIRASEQKAVDLKGLTAEKTALEKRIKEFEEQQAAQGAEQQDKKAELENEIEQGKRRRKRDFVMPIFQTLAGIGGAIATFFSLGGPELFESR